MIRRALVAVARLAGCAREQRRFQGPSVAPVLPPQTTLFAGEPPREGPTLDPALPGYKETAYAVSEGQALYSQFNCVGCHAHGGGAMGPPFLDEHWTYGSKPADIAMSIIAGRPRGMPSYRGKIVEQQLYSLVAYVRSIGGLVRGDAVPPRDDHMQAAPLTNLGEHGFTTLPKESP